VKPIDVLANGDVYYSAYDLLTPDDILFLKQVTGRSFDPATIAAEKAAGTFQGDPLAAAIGHARADFVHGWGGLGGDVDQTFLQSIQSEMTNPLGDGTSQGFLISRAELADAFLVLGNEPPPGVDLSM
jgi:hypothetical protein